ncbi:MAG: HD domain-containing protein [Syntrophaceae bacterium]
MKKLRDANFEAYFVGGSVRDLVRGVEPREFDIVTSAKPGEVRSLFARTVPVGESFGVILVIEDGGRYEVATFRTEENYEDGRRPSSVEFPAGAEEDVKRRDFTINGLLMDPLSGEIRDFVGGRADIEKRIVRTIGDPEERFAEDHLRMLRAVRFASSLGFAIERRTFEAIKKGAPAITRISSERVRDELTKVLTGCDARRGMELLASTGLLSFLLPEVEALRGLEQPPAFHPEGDVWEHTLRMLHILSAERGRRPDGRTDGQADPRLAWAILLHDVGKSETQSVDERGIHFYRHAGKGRSIAAQIMQRLRFSNNDIETVTSLINHHMQFINVMDKRPARLKKFLRMPHFDLHLELHRLDSLASNGGLEAYHFCRRKLAEMGEEELAPHPLLTGDDLIRMGFRPGPLFSRILAAVEEAQMEGGLKSPGEARRFVLRRWGKERGTANSN